MYVNKYSDCYLFSESRIKRKGEREREKMEVRCRNTDTREGYWKSEEKAPGGLPREEIPRKEG